MDGSLSSSRHGGGGGSYNRYNNRRGGGGGYRRGRGGGGYHDRDRRYQPYNRRGGSRHGGGRGGRRHNSNPGNRFDNNTSTKSVDPQSAMLKQLTAMVAKMGDLIACAEIAKNVTQSSNVDTADGLEMRGVVKAVSRNIQDLAVVLCSAQNAPLFLKFDEATSSNQVEGEDAAVAEADAVKAGDEAGPLASLVASCAASLPLQTPSYVGLTLAVEENSPDACEETMNVSYKGFAHRCVTLASRILASDLDKCCGVISLLSSEELSANNVGSGNVGDSNSAVDAFMRSKLLLRYFALLARVGIVKGVGETDDVVGNSGDISSLSIGGLLKALTVAASSASDVAKTMTSSMDDDGTGHNKATMKSFRNASIFLVALVLSTIPYSVHFLSKYFVMDLLTTIDEIVMGYKSPFQPGSGIMSILLEKELKENFIVKNEDEEEEESDSDDDDEDDEGSSVCADTFQDLLRTVRKLVESFYSSESNQKIQSNFALLSDAPWLGLEGKEEEYAPMEGDAEDELAKRSSGGPQALTFSGQAISIELPECHQLLRYLLNLAGNGGNFEGVALTIQCPSVEGAIFGRLSIFDPPPDEDDEEDESSNDPDVDAYVQKFSMMDRFFLAESVRDCLICHRATVSETGVESGSAKEAAEQVWAVSQLFSSDSKSAAQDDTTMGEEHDASKGVECGIVETVLSLIVQSPRGIDSPSQMSHVYLSRVLIELAKYKPSLIPKVLAVAISNLFNDFIPSLSPIAKENLSNWMAFHLTNTDYQWPEAFWNIWTPYVIKGMAMNEDSKSQRNSRGEFVTKAIASMSSFVSSPKTIVIDCLPSQSPLVRYVVPDVDSKLLQSAFVSTLQSVQDEISDRVWKNHDDPEDIRDYIIGDEVSESVQGNIDIDIEGTSSADDMEKLWWRTGLILRSILKVVSRGRDKLRRIVDGAVAQSSSSIDLDDSMMDDHDDDDGKVDVVTDLADYVRRYKVAILAALAKDIQVHEENLDLRGESKKSENDMVLMGEVYVLRLCEKFTAFSSSVFFSCVEVLLRQKIVSAMGVLHWILGSENRGSTSEELCVTHSWWDFASLAVRLSVDNILSDSESLTGADGSEIGMIIDNVGDDDDDNNVGTPSARRMKKVTDFVSPLLLFASKRIHSAIINNGDSKRPLSHLEVDLREGLKYLVRSVSSHVASSLKNDDTVKATAELGGSSLEVEIWVAKCRFDESLLVSLS